MGRVGDIYQVPSGTYGSPNTTISSTAYNANVNDVAADLNFPRPIVAGGTAATNDTMARANLKTERSAQVITDFNTTPYEFGSFTSATSVANSPVAGHAFTGIVYGTDANNLTVEARDVNDTVVPGSIYVREKKAGTWVNSGAWSVDQSGAFVLKAGDTMTGDLIINKVSPAFTLVKSTVPEHCQIVGALKGTPNKARWLMSLGDDNGESGSNAGSNFSLFRYADNGTTVLGNALNINRANGNVGISGDLTVANASAPTTGKVFFGGSGTKTLAYDGTNFNFTGGALVVNSPIYCASTALTGYCQFGTSGTKYLNYDGTIFNLVGGALNVSAAASLNGNLTSKDAGDAYSGVIVQNASAVTRGYVGLDTANDVIRMQHAGNLTAQLSIDSTARTRLGRGFAGRAGQDGAYNVHFHNFDWDGTGVTLWINVTNLGRITTSCDYRAKRDVEPMPSTWERVKALNPITFRYKDYGELFKASDDLQWGFLAHELQDTLLPTAATGKKDAEGVIQSPNLLAVVAGLTKALQEAMARIEALEARL